MERTLSYSFLKKEIINIDELNRKLAEHKRIQSEQIKWVHSKETQIQQKVNEAKKLKLINETLATDLQIRKNDFDSATSENVNLKERVRELENDLNKLHLQLQSTNQELITLQKYDHSDAVAKKPTKGTNAATKLKKSLSKQQEVAKNSKDDVMFTKLAELKSEKQELIKSKANFELETYELKKKISSLQSILDAGASTSEELNNLKNDIVSKNGEIKNLKEQKHSLQADNERLQMEHLLSKQEILKLEKSHKKRKEQNDQIDKHLEHVGTLTANIESSDEKIKNLKKEIANLHLKYERLVQENEQLKDKNHSFQFERAALQGGGGFTEIRPVGDDNINLPEENYVDHTDVENPKNYTDHKVVENPMEIVGPPEIFRENTPTDSEVSNILEEMIIPSIISPVYEITSEFNLNTPDSSVRPKNSEPSLTYHNLKEIVNRRRTRKRIFVKRPQPVDLYGILLALKKANINFIISNDSILSPARVEKKKQSTVTKELNCTLECCNNTYMVVQECDNDDDAPLLGFVGVKNEAIKENRPIVDDVINDFVFPKPTQPIRRGRQKRNSAKVKNRPVDEWSDGNVQRKSFEMSDVENISVNDNLQNQTTTCRNINLEVEEINDDCGSNNHFPVINSEEKADDPCLEVSKNKRKKSDFLTPVIKKKKADPKNRLTITNCPSSDPAHDTTDSEHSNKLIQNLTLRKSPRSKSKIALQTLLNITRRSPRLATGKEDDEIMHGDEQEDTISTESTRKISLKRSRRHSERLASVKEQNTKNENGESTQEPEKEETLLIDSPLSTPPRATFKRPVCSTRHSLRLIVANIDNEKSENSDDLNQNNVDKDENSDDNEVKQEGEKPETIPIESPQSPTPQDDSASDKPILIPLEKAPENVKKIPPSKIEVLFNKLISYSTEEEALKEVVQEFSFQEPEYIAGAILERIAVDYHEEPTTISNSRAPLMTHAQRTMLGFMAKLEKNNVLGVFKCYLKLAEHRLLTCKSLQELVPITGLYLAVCKLNNKLTTMRKLCCDVFYFCGGLAVPFLFIVLKSWPEVLPNAMDAQELPLARVLVQIVYTMDCHLPGYNLMNLRDLLIKQYGYPTERWDYNDFFKELLNGYLKNPTKRADFALLLYCKSRPEKWVYDTIEEHFKPMINMEIQDNFKATLIILIGNLYNRFSSKSEDNYLPRIREWFLSLIKDDTPDVVKKCIYVSLNRLKKK